jgi:dTDP-4-dehydrorhamnose reductase
MKVLLTGAAGQLGRALLAGAPPGMQITALDVAELDITSSEAVAAAVAKLKPEAIINAAAYTQVDRAESDQPAAHAVNALGPENLARAANDAGARLIHISTDYVFSGAGTTPYRPNDPTAPLGVYGKTKLEGEQRALKHCGKTLIVRTAWLYSANGANFVHTMLKLMRERDELRVVADQHGAPTWAATLAHVVWAGVERPALRGIYHWTDAGVTTWHGFAVAIQEEALALGLLARQVPVRAIRTQEYPTPARRPAYSVLDSAATVADFGVTQTPWRDALRAMLKDVAHA